jgi:hypothetical protein
MIMLQMVGKTQIRMKCLKNKAYLRNLAAVVTGIPLFGLNIEVNG